MTEPQNQTTPSDAPALSVILVIGGQRERERRALQSLLGQSAIDRMEILLYDLGPVDCPPIPGSDHPRVRLTRWTPEDLLGNSARRRRSRGQGACDLFHGRALRNAAGDSRGIHPRP